MSVLHNRRGITLVETLVVLVLTGIIMATLMVFFTTSLNLFGRGDRQTEVQQQARIAINHLRNDLTAAIAQDVETGTGGQVVSLERLEAGQGGPDQVAVNYTLENGTLYRQSKGSKNPVALHVETVEVDMEGSIMDIRVVAAKDEVRTELTTRVQARN